MRPFLLPLLIFRDNTSVFKYIGLYLLIILGLFVEPEFLGTVGNILFKVLILAGASYLLYEIWNMKELSEGEKDEALPQALPRSEPPKPVFESNSARLDHFVQNSDALKTYLENQFTLFWNYTLPHNGYLVFCYRSTPAKIFEQRSNSPVSQMTAMNFSQLYSLLEKSDSILIENNLVDAGALFPFYNQEEYQPRSLLAFKTEINSEQALCWFFDADADNFFNNQDKQLFRQMNSNTLYAITETFQNKGLIEEYSEGQKISELSNQMNQASDFDQCIELFTDFLIDQFQASKFTIALREAGAETAEIKTSIGIDDSTKPGYSFTLSEGLHGWVILKNKPYLIDNIDKGEYFVPRFSRDEKTNYALRSLLSVPLQNGEDAFGMVSLEDKRENQYSEIDKKRLIRFTKILGSAYERFKK